jgi:hypothetical protein
MNADVGFGWLVFVGFLIWVLQVLRAGAKGGMRRGPSPPPRAPGADATQREGQQLEEMLRQLEGRLGQREAGQRQPGQLAQRGTGQSRRAPVVIKRPSQLPPRPRPQPPGPARSRAEAPPADGVSLEIPVDREAEAEAIERRRLEAVEARSQALTDADHAAFEARLQSQAAAPAAALSIRRLTARQLRDAFIWNEVLGPPVGLRP